MKKQNQQEVLTYGATFGIFSLVAILWFLIPRVENFGSISSSEIDTLLYQRLESYELALAQDDAMDEIVQTALTYPDELAATDRSRYIDFEQRFFNGWEVAWEHRTAGYFDQKRFQVWDDWYLKEARRRPSFAWTENRGNFSPAFVRHVDELLGIKVAEISVSN